MTHQAQADARRRRDASLSDIQWTPEELRDYCLSLLGAHEEFPFGPDTSAFKVAGKIFALSRLAEDPLRISLKCDPALAEELREAHAAVMPGYHLNERHWNTVIIDGSLSDELISNMVERDATALRIKISLPTAGGDLSLSRGTRTIRNVDDGNAPALWLLSIAPFRGKLVEYARIVARSPQQAAITFADCSRRRQPLHRRRSGVSGDRWPGPRARPVMA